jgi:hypothetical protein
MNQSETHDSKTYTSEQPSSSLDSKSEGQIEPETVVSEPKVIYPNGYRAFVIMFSAGIPLFLFALDRTVVSVIV